MYFLVIDGLVVDYSKDLDILKIFVRDRYVLYSDRSFDSLDEGLYNFSVDSRTGVLYIRDCYVYDGELKYFVGIRVCIVGFSSICRLGGTSLFSSLCGWFRVNYRRFRLGGTLGRYYLVYPSGVGFGSSTLRGCLDMAHGMLVSNGAYIGSGESRITLGDVDSKTFYTCKNGIYYIPYTIHTKYWTTYDFAIVRVDSILCNLDNRYAMVLLKHLISVGGTLEKS